TPASTERTLKVTDRISNDGKEGLTDGKKSQSEGRAPTPTERTLKVTDRISNDGKEGLTDGKKSRSDGKSSCPDGKNPQGDG
ncbi:hypothetical protein ABH966_004536, partial [Lysinibacillus sp. RC46]|uniref:hypothetical protein n=1 Tax=Lysinibacillus sp. RC46 TaxID=3156295 RepID=UPI003513B035